jgi:hypothetical protein
MADGVRLYVGPSSLLIVTPSALIPLLFSGVAYSYDYSISKYRFTLQRPVVEHRDRFLEKVRGVQRGIGGALGFGIAFNAMPGMNAKADRRGIWLPNCDNLTQGLSVPTSGAIIDVVAGVCDEPQFWPDPPTSDQPEY